MNVSYVFAEQSAADEYRRLFKSGTFFLEYKNDYEVKVLAAFNNKRIERIDYTKLKWMTYFNPLGALIGGYSSKLPEVLYQNGKYYQFIDEDNAIVLSENQLRNKNLDPRQGWNKVTQKLAVPIELSVFYWDDPYLQKSNSISKPQFISSEKKNIDDKDYDCDKYISEVKSSNGSSNVQILYEIFYNENKLSEAHLFILQNETIYPINEIKIKTLQGEVPKGAFKINKKTKVYAAGMGDISDLIQQPSQVEILGALE